MSDREDSAAPPTSIRVAVVGVRGVPDVPGGVERHCDELYPRLAARGVDVTIYNRPGYGGNGEYSGVRLASSAAIRGKGLEAYSHTASAILAARGTCDLLHIQSIGPSSLIGFARAVGHRHVVSTVHAPDYLQAKWGALARALLRHGERQACTKADAVICVASWYANQLARAYDCTPDVVPNGPGLSHEVNQADNGFAASVGIAERPYILSVGRLIPDKRFELLIDAVTAADIDLDVVIAGGSAATDDYAAALTARGGDRVRLLGAVVGGDLASVYRHATLFALPSSQEGLPVSLLEAMQFGIPCVAARIDGSAEVLGDAGLYFTPDRADELAGQLRQLTSDAALRQALSAKGRERVARDFSWDAIAEKTLEVYRRALAG